MQSLVFDPLMKQERYQLELKNQTKSGRAIYVRLRLSTLRDEAGNIVSIIGCSNNISDRKKYEQDLLESTQFLETVLESFPLLVSWKDINLNYLGCNHNFAKAYGLSSVSAIQGKVNKNMPWHSSEIKLNEIQERGVIKSGKAQLGMITKHQQRNGDVVWLETINWSL
jgi:PAS domain-containing protein